MLICFKSLSAIAIGLGVWVTDRTSPVQPIIIQIILLQLQLLLLELSPLGLSEVLGRG